MLVTNETAVLNARSGRTPFSPAGLSGSAPCTRWSAYSASAETSENESTARAY